MKLKMGFHISPLALADDNIRDVSFPILLSDSNNVPKFYLEESKNMFFLFRTYSKPTNLEQKPLIF